MNPTTDRPWTPDKKTPTGHIITVKRACNGCHRLIGDVTETEMDCAAAGIDLPDVREECGCEHIDEIRARTQASTPGPWRWHGNADYPYSLSLESRDWVVLATHGVPRSSDDEGGKQYLDYLHEQGCPADKDRAEWESDLAEQVSKDYVLDAWGNPIEDQRLFMRVPGQDGLDLEPLHKHVIFEVCKEAIDRKDPRVYRADFTQTRSPDAQLIAHSRTDIDWLLAEVDRLRALLNTARAGA